MNARRFLLVVRTIAVSMLLSSATWQVMAQAEPSAEATILRYAEATRTYDTNVLSGFLHPEALKRLRVTVDAALRGPKQHLAVTELLPLFSAASIEEFSMLSDREVYKRLNDNVAKLAPELIDMMSKATFEIDGSFLKNDLAYVTYTLKATANGKPISVQTVQSLKMHEGKWLLMLPTTAEASIATIEARFH